MRGDSGIKISELKIGSSQSHIGDETEIRISPEIVSESLLYPNIDSDKLDNAIRKGGPSADLRGECDWVEILDDDEVALVFDFHYNNKFDILTTEFERTDFILHYDRGKLEIEDTSKNGPTDPIGVDSDRDILGYPNDRREITFSQVWYPKDHILEPSGRKLGFVVPNDMFNAFLECDNSVFPVEIRFEIE